VNSIEYFPHKKSNQLSTMRYILANFDATKQFLYFELLVFESRDTEHRGQRCYFGYVVVCSWTVSSTAHILTAYNIFGTV
jgi:hypothetical protein